MVLTNACNSLILISVFCSSTKLTSRGFAKRPCGNNNRWNVKILHHKVMSDILFSLPVSHSMVGSSATRVLKRVISSRWQSGMSLITFPKSSWRSGYTTTLRAGRDANKLEEEKWQPCSTLIVSLLSYFQKWDFPTDVTVPGKTTYSRFTKPGSSCVINNWDVWDKCVLLFCLGRADTVY